MAILITQARYTKDGLRGVIAAPEDQAEAVGRLITQVRGRLIAYYLTSGEYDILLIYEVPSYEDAVPALVVAAAGSGIADLKTVMALTADEMKSAFAKAGAIAASSRSTGAPPVTDQPNSREGSTGAVQADATAAAAILDAQKKSVDEIKAGRSAPYTVSIS
jgi:uncharacterized protein with GYD domain